MVSTVTVRLLAVFVVFTSMIMAFRSYLPHDRPYHLRNDFAHYYISAALYHSGQNPYDVDLTPYYKSFEFAPIREIARATNPPALIQLTEPLALTDSYHAYLYWTLLQIGAFIGAILLGLRLFGTEASPLEKLFLILAATLTCPFVAHLRYGQTQALMSLLIIGGLYLLKRERTQSGALLWGIATSLKLFTWPLALVLVRHKGKRSLVGFTIGAVVLQIPMLLRLGTAPFSDFARHSVPYIRETVIQFVGNISMSGSSYFSAQLLFPSGNFQSLLTLISLVSVLGVIAGTFYLLNRADSELQTDTAAILGISIIFAPTAWNHYLVLLYPFFLLALTLLRKAPDSATFVLLLLIDLLVVDSSVGWVRGSDFLTQLITLWWGILGATGFVALLLAARKMGEAPPIPAEASRLS